MKYKIIIFIALAAFFTGCLTMPDPVDENFLKEKTSEENAKLDKIGAEIIAKKKDKDKVEKDSEITVQKVELSRKELKQAEAYNDVLLEKEKLYSSTQDPKLQDVQKEKQDNSLKIAQLKAKLDYDIAKDNETKALLEVKKSGLAVKVAELNYEQALIAKAYQMKRQKEYEKNMIDDELYKKFFDDQKIKLEDNQKEYEKAAKILTEKEDVLKKSGYEGEK